MSPSKIGFIVSLILHLFLIIIFIKTDTKQLEIKNNTISINLSNVVNAEENKPLKTKTEKKIVSNKIEKKHVESNNAPKIKPLESEIKSITKDNTKSNIESSAESNVESKDLGDSNNNNEVQTLDENSDIFTNIKNIINENNKYPKIARKRGIEGSVIVEFILFKNGKISDVKIINETHKLLARGAIEAIERAYIQFPSTNNNLKIKITLSYNLI